MFLLGYHRWPVQNAKWYRLIQSRSVANWPILYPTSVKESPERLTKFICGFLKCHSVCSNIWEVSFATTLLILMPLTRKWFGWTHLWLNFLFSFIQAAEDIHSFPFSKLSKHEIVWKQRTTFLNRAREIPEDTLSQKRSSVCTKRENWYYLKYNCYRPLRRKCGTVIARV